MPAAGLITGIGFQEMLGANPYKLGVVGGGDSHNALQANEEFNYFGVHGNTDKTVEVRMASTGSVAGEPALFFGTPGATGVWAPENTREAIFDGIARRETYGTSGPLMRVRFFGGWEFQESDALNRLPAEAGYTKGVPMGGTLEARDRLWNRQKSRDVSRPDPVELILPDRISAGDTSSPTDNCRLETMLPARSHV